MRGRLPGMLALACALSGCGVGAEQIRADLASGQSRGAYLESVPFEPQRPGHCGPSALSSLLGYWGRPVSQEEIGREIYSPTLNGTLGFDLWRYARRAGLVSLEAQRLDPERLAGLLSQGIPVILDLDLGFGPASLQHYVLAVGLDRTRWLWIIQDGRRPDRVVPARWLMGHWTRANGWALIAFPPDRKVTGLGAGLHRDAARDCEEKGNLDAAFAHLEQAVSQRPEDPDLWFQMGRVCKRAGKPAAAERAYRQAMALEPDVPDPVNNLALVVMEDPNRLAEAQALAQKAVDLCRKDGRPALRLPYALDTLALVLERMGRIGDAADALETALSTAEPGSDLAGGIRDRLRDLRARRAISPSLPAKAE